MYPAVSSACEATGYSQQLPSNITNIAVNEDMAQNCAMITKQHLRKVVPLLRNCSILGYIATCFNEKCWCGGTFIFEMSRNHLMLTLPRRHFLNVNYTPVYQIE